MLIRDEADRRRPPVLYFHGGHESAPPASELYVALGYPVLRVSRAQLGIKSFTAVVGTSFGGRQAIEYAGRHPTGPSTLPYPGSPAQRVLGRVLFHPSVERYVWRAVGRLLRLAPQHGLRLMMRSLSTQPVRSWLPYIAEANREAMRAVLSRPCDQNEAS